MGCGVDK